MEDIEISGDPGRKLEKIFFGSEIGFSYKTFMPMDAALLDAVNSQQKLLWKPQNPRTILARSLFMSVRAALKLPHGDESFSAQSKNLRLFCALNTALDFHFGIDGFFTISTKHPGRLTPEDIVTFDLTYRTSALKKMRQKADFLITEEDLRDRERNEYLVEQIKNKLRQTQTQVSMSGG